jgi:hypothetical protein
MSDFSLITNTPIYEYATTRKVTTQRMQKRNNAITRKARGKRGYQMSDVRFQPNNQYTNIRIRNNAESNNAKNATTQKRNNAITRKAIKRG